MKVNYSVRACTHTNTHTRIHTHMHTHTHTLTHIHTQAYVHGGGENKEGKRELIREKKKREREIESNELDV